MQDPFAGIAAAAVASRISKASLTSPAFRVHGWGGTIKSRCPRQSVRALNTHQKDSFRPFTRNFEGPWEST